MNEEKSLMVGFDLSNDYTQISCFNSKTFEPESVYEIDEVENYLIPTVLALRNDTKEWVFGKNAISLYEKKEASLVRNIIQAVTDKKDILVQEMVFSSVSLLEKFFRKTLHLLQTYYPNSKIGKLVVTIEELNQTLLDGIFTALEPLSLYQDRVVIQSHVRSSIYYALSQKRELWMNDIGIFDFNDRGLYYYQINVNRKRMPILVQVEQKNFCDKLDYTMFSELDKKKQVDSIFSSVAKNVLEGKVVSTIYVTGKGFEGSWVEPILKELCVGRRVFKGQNLYTMGACYAAKELLQGERFKDFFFLTDEILVDTITIRAYCDAAIRELVLVKAGISWYEVDRKIEFILDGETEVTLIRRNLLKKDPVYHMIPLDELEERPNKMTRIELRIQFLDVNSCVVMLKDKGFGEFYPSTNRVWEHMIGI